METFKKGLLNNELRKSLFLRETPITTKADLKKAVAAAQVGLLQYARTYTNPPASATAGLGAIQKDELETRRKTNWQVTEVLKRYGPVTTNSAEEEKRPPWSWMLYKKKRKEVERNTKKEGKRK